MSYTRMPFGKYKGIEIPELPSNYLLYALETFDLPEELTMVLTTTLYDRLVSLPNCGVYFENIVLKVGIEEHKIKAAYKALTLKYHPDKGGSHEAMQAINEFRDLLNNQ
jgi:uncharacterized protein (DUF3820 family)